MEQEFFNFMLLEHKEGIVDFLEYYSSHEYKRREMVKTLLHKDIDKIDEFTPSDEIKDVPTNSTETLRSMCKGIGLLIENEKDT